MGTFGSIGVQLRLSTSLVRYFASQRCQLHHAIIVMLLLLRFQETFTLCPTQIGTWHAVTLEKQLIESINFRTTLDQQSSISPEVCERLEEAYRETSQNALSEPFFSVRQQLCALVTSFSTENKSAPYS